MSAAQIDPVSVGDSVLVQFITKTKPGICKNLPEGVGKSKQFVTLSKKLTLVDVFVEERETDCVTQFVFKKKAKTKHANGWQYLLILKALASSPWRVRGYQNPGKGIAINCNYRKKEGVTPRCFLKIIENEIRIS